MAELEMARLQGQRAAEEVQRAAVQARSGSSSPTPPLASCLTVPRRIAPDGKTPDNYPYLDAAGSHSRLLLYATQGPDPEPPALDAFYSRPLGVHHGFAKAYFICDAATREAIYIPDPDHPFV
ncbi:hypothetical protein E2562_035892 [Oryza meyeriana var. granulata]|uniref:Uncharacterized protein n=1 Tax=Oryza meyeriana var. granulata TaxID=110450 RepID=A0A6G1E673_9ORYZ|nr:hypothetical protein E2562_035892 [Oryza meyeriana var. granulata]